MQNHLLCLVTGSMGKLNVAHIKNYKVIPSKQQFMKTENVVLGLLVLMFAVILFGDAVLTTFNPDSMMLSPNDVKGIAGFTFLLIAILILIEARK
jgi:hypothetical protein